jgi:glycogen operon protein
MLRLVMDSLRYWVEEMHVDGFRFDLAPAISRNALGGFDHRGPFLSAVAQDPVLKRVKMIAEPWDLGDHGYQVGGFPQGWSEWNGQYRDRVRDYWRGIEGSLPDFAAALCGSSDIYAPSRRMPRASVNIVTVHDGFTLEDLVSYNEKHNEANQEDNRDGESHNRSWNCGVEGPTDDPEILAFRERQKRNFLTTLFASRGVPLLLGGDEMGRTQGGNNNAYCQDNPVSWFDWSDERRQDPLLSFTQAVLRLRRELPVLRHNAWLTGQPDDDGRRDIVWYSVWGVEMTEEEWTNPAVRCVAAVLDARFAPSPPPDAARSVLLMFNAKSEDVTFTLPRVPADEGDWLLRIYTAEGHFEEADARRHAAGAHLELRSHSMALLTQAPQE